MELDRGPDAVRSRLPESGATQKYLRTEDPSSDNKLHAFGTGRAVLRPAGGFVEAQSPVLYKQ